MSQKVGIIHNLK